MKKQNGRSLTTEEKQRIIEAHLAVVAENKAAGIWPHQNFSEVARRANYHRQTVRAVVEDAIASDSPQAVASETSSTEIDTDRARFRLESQLKEYQDKYKDALSQLGDAEARAEVLLDIQQPVKPIKITVGAKSAKGEAVAIAQASDWHVEERVDPQTVNGLNEYNPEIAEARAQTYFKNLLKLVRKERQDVAIDTLILHVGGDLVSGYIHEELEESNYLSPVEAVQFAKRLILGGLKFLKEDGEFKRIVVPTSYGNHGRSGKKLRVSTGHKNSFEWMIYRDMAGLLANDDVISFQVVDGYFNYVECFGQWLRFHHGDAIKYGGGIGGVTIPLLRYLARVNMQRPATADFLGHFHQLTPYSRSNRFVVNGSLIGFNSYAQRIGASPEPPLQSFHLFDAKHGFTISAPIIVEDEAR